MPFSIELFFDPDTEARIRDWRMRLAARFPGLEGGDLRPHLSLAVLDDLDPETPAHLATAVRNMAAGVAGFPILFQHYGVFPGPPGVVFLGPKVDASLLALHARCLEASGIAVYHHKFWPYYAAEAWVPHCTLSMCGLDAVPAALALLAGCAELPLRGRVTGLGLTRFPAPVEYVVEETLAEAPPEPAVA